MAGSTSRLVYSTGGGEVCPRCGWPIRSCACSSKAGTQEAVPAKVTAKLRVEKKGRGGKMVTLVDGLPRNDRFLGDLCGELKRACGTGGAVADGTIELQGDLRDRLRGILAAKGFAVRG